MLQQIFCYMRVPGSRGTVLQPEYSNTSDAGSKGASAAQRWHSSRDMPRDGECTRRDALHTPAAGTRRRLHIPAAATCPPARTARRPPQQHPPPSPSAAALQDHLRQRRAARAWPASPPYSSLACPRSTGLRFASISKRAGSKLSLNFFKVATGDPGTSVYNLIPRFSQCTLNSSTPLKMLVFGCLTPLSSAMY